MPDKSLAPLVQFHFLLPVASLRERKRLKAFIISLFRKEKIKLNSLTYIFCSDEYLLGINQQFLKHNYYTDIISFNLANKAEPVNGEIYISVDRVLDNAQTLSVPFRIELYRVIFHGALHLCGYKDKSPRDISLMRKMEDKCLEAYLP